MNQQPKYQPMSIVKTQSGHRAFVMSYLPKGDSFEYRLDEKCYSGNSGSNMGWYDESEIVETVKIYRKGRYWLPGVW